MAVVVVTLWCCDVDRVEGDSPPDPGALEKVGHEHASASNVITMVVDAGRA